MQRKPAGASQPAKQFATTYMRKLYLCGLLLLVSSLAHSQQTELSGQLTSGVSNFRGRSAGRNTWLDSGPYANNLYGRRPGPAYGLAAQAQRVTRQHMLFGVQAGYEVLQSRARVTDVIYGDIIESASAGHVTLKNQFLNAYPFYGHRFGRQVLTLDIAAGPEFGFGLKSTIKGRATTTSGLEFDAAGSQPIPTVDVRARLNLTATYKKAGLQAGYSYGLTNYQRGYLGGINEAYAQVWRLSASYRWQ